MQVALRRRCRRAVSPAGRSSDGGADWPRQLTRCACRRRARRSGSASSGRSSVFGALAVAACLLAPLVGSTTISLARVFDRSIPYADNVDAQIFFVARLPRVLAAALVGSALALSGVVFQALLRNPLASPDTLGVSAGASLGAMIAITFDARFSFLGVSAISHCQLRRLVRRARHRLRHVGRAAARRIDAGAAARRRHAARAARRR